MASTWLKPRKIHLTRYLLLQWGRKATVLLTMPLGTNTYILGTGARKLLIDAGQGIPEYVPLLEESLRSISPNAYISDIIVTHAHPDHFGGLKDILASSILNSRRNIRIHKYPASSKNAEGHRGFPQDVPFSPLQDNQVFKIDPSLTLRVLYTPGHTKDHCTFLLEEEQSLFTADCVLGQGTAVFEDLSEYLEGLHRLVSLEPKRLYPGHGPVVEDGVTRINEYIQHREEREKQVVNVMTSEGPDKTWSATDIAGKIYQGLPTTLFLAATRGIVLHLLKLEKDGKVRLTEGTSEGSDVMDLIDKEWRWIG